MKLIKPGRDQKGWAKEFECTGNGNGEGGCGAILLIEEADIYQTSHSSYDGETIFYQTFTCMQCGSQTDIEHLPFSVTQTKSQWLAKK